MSISDDVRSHDVRSEHAFVERCRHSELLYSKNGQYKTVELNLEKSMKNNMQKIFLQLIYLKLTVTKSN